MNKTSNILNQLQKAPKPMVPNGFFDQFADEALMLAKLEAETEGLLDKLVLKRFKNDYKKTTNSEFEAGNVISSLKPDVVARRSKTKQIILWTGAVAASLALFFAWPTGANQSAEIANTELSEEVLLAYLDEDDLVEFLIDYKVTELQDLDIEEVLYEEIEDEIYEYLNDI